MEFLQIIRATVMAMVMATAMVMGMVTVMKIINTKKGKKYETFFPIF